MVLLAHVHAQVVTVKFRLTADIWTSDASNLSAVNLIFKVIHNTNQAVLVLAVVDIVNEFHLVFFKADSTRKHRLFVLFILSIVFKLTVVSFLTFSVSFPFFAIKFLKSLFFFFL